jgi:hypothetical protein
MAWPKTDPNPTSWANHVIARYAACSTPEISRGCELHIVLHSVKYNYDYFLGMVLGVRALDTSPQGNEIIMRKISRYHRCQPGLGSLKMHHFKLRLLRLIT